MKILAFVDMHGSFTALKKLKQKAKNADIVVCAGDISIFEQNLEYLITSLDKINKPVLMIPGNHESENILKAACKGFKNIHYVNEKLYKKNSAQFLCIEGNGFALTDKIFEKAVRNLKKNLDPEKKLVLVTHAPPHGTKVDRIIDMQCGNKSVRNAVKQLKPVLHICGHLHENAGVEDRIGITRVINPGPFGKILTV